MQYLKPLAHSRSSLDSLVPSRSTVQTVSKVATSKCPRGKNTLTCLDKIHQSCSAVLATELVGYCLVVEDGGGV